MILKTKQLTAEAERRLKSIIYYGEKYFETKKEIENGTYKNTTGFCITYESLLPCIHQFHNLMLGKWPTKTITYKNYHPHELHNLIKK